MNFLKFTLALLILWLIFFYTNLTQSYGLIETLISLIFATTFKLLGMNKDRLRVLVCSILNYNSPVRISYAYLIRIYNSEKGYFLIRGNGEKHNRLKPVGGAYKSIDESYLRELDATRQTKHSEQNDVRFFIKGMNLLKFLDMLYKKNVFEHGCNREFYEELIESGIFPKNLFEKLSFNFEKREIDIKENKHYREQFPNSRKEILIHEIFNLNLSKKQLEYFMLLPKSDERYAIVSGDDIKVKSSNYILLGDKKFEITDHSYKIKEGIYE